MSDIKIVETTNGIHIHDNCPLCRGKMEKEDVRAICRGPTERYYEDGNYHYHDSGVYEGKWYCNNGHSGLYYQHRLCSVVECDFGRIN